MTIVDQIKSRVSSASVEEELQGMGLSEEQQENIVVHFLLIKGDKNKTQN